ncbi:hypothetical protein D3C78_1383810 [compost metagenome]
MPEKPSVTPSGEALAAATTSAKVLKRELAAATITMGEDDTRATGARSLSGL